MLMCYYDPPVCSGDSNQFSFLKLCLDPRLSNLSLPLNQRLHRDNDYAGARFPCVASSFQATASCQTLHTSEFN